VKILGLQSGKGYYSMVHYSSLMSLKVSLTTPILILRHPRISLAMWGGSMVSYRVKNLSAGTRRREEAVSSMVPATHIVEIASSSICMHDFIADAATPSEYP